MTNSKAELRWIATENYPEIGYILTASRRVLGTIPVSLTDACEVFTGHVFLVRSGETMPDPATYPVDNS